jgi:tRNA A-37 threonylcarbamoyl transferase component Bud32
MSSDDPQFTNTLPSQGAAVERGRAADELESNLAKPLEPGEFIGRYRVRERIGEGGMGVVYAAEDPELGRVVAIKLLRPVHGDEAELQQRRMLREAQALARVSHRNLVMVFDVGSRQGRVWIAMEYIAGDTLEMWLGRERRTWAEIVDVFVEAGRGLAAVHAAGLVHRDFKPGNVIVRKDGTVQVLDFGLAARAGEREEPQRAPTAADLDVLAATLTTTGAFMGTPAYMAPEQFLMRPTDGRADQFSLCVALYEALYGHRPFKGQDLAQLMAATLEGLPGLPAEMPGLPIAVRQVIARGMSREPDDRFPDMDALLQALHEIRTPVQPARGGGWSRFALGIMVGGGALAIATAVWLATPGDVPIDAAAPVTEPTPTMVAPAAAAAASDEPEERPIILAAPPPDDPAPLVDADPSLAADPSATGGGATPRSEPRGLPATIEPGPADAAMPVLPGLNDLDEVEPAPSAPAKPSEPAAIEPPAEPKPTERPSTPAATTASGDPAPSE